MVYIVEHFFLYFSECRPGYYKLKDGCVANCPEHYFGIMQMVQLRSTLNSTTTRPKFQRHGICNECNEACRTCKGPQVSDCFQCSDGYERRDNLCQKKLLLNFLDPDMLGFFVWVIVLCIAAIILFGVIFGLLQARDHKLLCWKEKKEVDTTKGDYHGMTLTREELENDLENYDIIRNRNFRHGSVPENHDHVCRVQLTEPLTSLNSYRPHSGNNSRVSDIGRKTSATHIERTNDTHRSRTNSNLCDAHISHTNSNTSDMHMSRTNSNVSNGHIKRTNSNISDTHIMRTNSNISDAHMSRNNSNISDALLNRTNSNLSEALLNRTSSNISDTLISRTNSNVSDRLLNDVNPSSYRSSSSNHHHKRGHRSSGHSRHHRMSSSRH